MTILITGGAGFIGSNFVRDWLDAKLTNIVNLDKLTYAGNLDNLTDALSNPLHHFVQGDIADSALVNKLLTIYQPTAIINLEHFDYWRRLEHIGPTCLYLQLMMIQASQKQLRHHFVIYISVQMKCMVLLSNKILHLQKKIYTNLIALILRVKLHLIIWFVHITIPTDCQY